MSDVGIEVKYPGRRNKKCTVSNQTAETENKIFLTLSGFQKVFQENKWPHGSLRRSVIVERFTWGASWKWEVSFHNSLDLDEEGRHTWPPETVSPMTVEAELWLLPRWRESIIWGRNWLSYMTTFTLEPTEYSREQETVNLQIGKSKGLTRTTSEIPWLQPSYI